MIRKDRYIGRLYSEFGKVPSDSGIFRNTGELREFAGEYMGLIGPYGNRGERPKGRSSTSRKEKGEGEKERGAGPLSLSYSDQGGEGRAAHLWPLLLSSTKAH